MCRGSAPRTLLNRVESKTIRFMKSLLTGCLQSLTDRGSALFSPFFFYGYCSSEFGYCLLSLSNDPLQRTFYLHFHVIHLNNAKK